MNITISSFTALFFLYILSYFCDLVLKIHSDRFYSPFHFVGGFLVYTFVNSFLKIRLLSLFLVIIVGILWEIYEWLFWKYISKRKIDRQKKKDTTSDLILDFLGGLTALILTSLI